MLDAKDAALIAALRQDSRSKLKNLSGRTGMPLSTAHERLQKLIERQKVRLVSMPDYSKVGLNLTCWFCIDASDREGAKGFMLSSPHVNHVTEVSNGADLLCEAIFRSFSEQHAFKEGLEEYGKVESHPIIDEVARENASVQ